jgi:hypothetical protein
MDRRSFLGSAGTAVAAATILGARPAAADETGNPTPTGPVVDWEWVGGFVTPGVTALRAPRLVAYPNGLTIADADHESRLDREDLSDLRRHLVTVLADPASTRRRPGAPVIADAPATRFAVRAAHGTLYTADVEGLDEYRPGHAYPKRLYRLSDHLSAVHRRVLSTGATYEPAAVRLVAVVDSGSAPSTAAAWPRGIPVPTISPDAMVGQLALRGPVAHAVTRSFPRRDPWPEFRSSDGRLLRASWRFLLPHE